MPVILAYLSSDMSTAEGELLFVYGTLKRGQPNHNVMTDSGNGMATFVCCCQTVDKYPLVIATAANIPFLLVQKKGEGHNILGEVWEVDTKMRDTLDYFEGYPGYYDRVKIDVVKEGTAKHSEDHSNLKKLLTCWVYAIRCYSDEMLQRKHYADYDSYGEHGLPYKKEDDDYPEY